MIPLVKPGVQEKLRVSRISPLLGIKCGPASGVTSSTQTYNPVRFSMSHFMRAPLSLDGVAGSMSSILTG